MSRNPQRHQDPPQSLLPAHAPDEVACDACGLYGICQVAGLNRYDLKQLDQIVTRRDPVARGATLYLESEPFHAIYAVKSGAFKSEIQLCDGSTRIIDFHFAGELIGLDGIGAGHYPSTASALEKSSVCRLEFTDLDKFGPHLAEFQQELIITLSSQLLRQQQSTIVNQQIADQRLAALLLDIAHRFAEHRMPASQFRLSMSRGDIANYLGLALETVSRLFTRFRDEGVLEVHNRKITILDFDALRRLAG